MNEEIEIEFKCLVTKSQFQTLSADLAPGPFLKQQNHYFDTPDFLLKQAGAALRIREKKGKAEMTLKQPAETGLLESTIELPAEEVTAALNGKLPENDVVFKAGSLAGTTGFVYFGTLATSRAEMPYQNGLLVFDHSSYLGQEDYEIEFEAKNAEGEMVFRHFLQNYAIDYKPAQNKIRRFYQALKQHGGE